MEYHHHCKRQAFPVYSTGSDTTNLQNRILEALVSATAPAPPQTGAPYKFAVNSTIIQHTAPTTTHRPGGDEKPETNSGGSVGKRGNISPQTFIYGTNTVHTGMHSATGGYWNNDKDGIWSYKFEGGDDRGLDVVLSIIWVAV